ncbi:sulfotransferase, partial [Candidatus Bipolaricaulota bacterium]|nr:sulfotransferase [Candidatus Bipolaricaulota bacterium]
NMFERTRRIPRLLKEARLGSPKFQKYAKRAHAIYKAIQTVSGKPIIVDSSKNPARALALSLVPGIELSLIHMVRDGRGVIWSRMKSFRKNEQAGIERYLRSWPTWRSSFDWALGNCLSEWVARRVGSSLRLRYEDVVEKPDDALTTIGEYLGISLDSIAKKLAAGTKLFVGHNIAGSRIRMSKAITLYPDYEWKERLPRRSRFLFWILVGVVAKRYGYGKP